MSIESITDSVRKYARSRKERLLNATPHVLVVIRDGKLTAVLSCDDLGPLIRMAEIAGTSYGADALAIVIEGVVPLVDKNPVTGRIWERGEAEQLWLDGHGVDRGWVSETQIIAVALRDGATSEEAQSFRVNGDTVTWGSEPSALGGTGIAGQLSRQLDGPVMDSARVPNPGEGFVGDPVNGPFYDPDYGRIALDIGCTRVFGNQLLGRGEACLILDSEEQAEHFVREGLPSWQVELRA